jgi:hypothetical protein
MSQRAQSDPASHWSERKEKLPSIGWKIKKSSLIGQELLEMSTPVSNSMAAQLVFDTKRHKYCSTYNLAEGLDKVHINLIFKDLVDNPKKATAMIEKP